MGRKIIRKKLTKAINGRKKSHGILNFSLITNENVLQLIHRTSF